MQLFGQICLQAAHRLGAVAVFAILAAWWLSYQRQDILWAASATFAASDLGLCAGWLSILFLGRREQFGAEALGATIFNLVLLALSMQLMLYSRLDWIRWTVEHFLSSQR